MVFSEVLMILSNSVYEFPLSAFENPVKEHFADKNLFLVKEILF